MRTDQRRRALVLWLWIAAVAALATAQGSLPDSAPEVRIDSIQAKATLGLLAARARGETVPTSSWARVFESEGYKRALARERAIDERLGIDRGYSDKSFMEWARSDAALEGLAGRQRTLAAWADVDVDAAARRAMAYLPEDTHLEATVYPIVRKQTNSFVWGLPHDPAIFMSVGADVAAEEVQLTLAHELHHVGLSGRCAEPQEAADEGVAAARRWLSGFGEGLAVLAAAGGPEGEAHAPGQVDLRAAWKERLDNLESDIGALEAFLIDVAEGRTAGEEAQKRGMAFVSAEGVPQGAFYSVGWFMGVAVERDLGREAVVAATCDHGQLLTDYQRVAERRTDKALPPWSEHLLGVLDLIGSESVSQPSPQTATWITAHTDRNPTVSPDGGRLLFQSDRSGRRALYMRSVEGGPVTLFLDSGDEPRYADWSPDGERVVFAAEVDGEDDIFVINVDGSNRRRLTKHPARDGHPRWAPDGSRIFFNSERVASEPDAPQTGEDVVDIFSIRPDGTDLIRHTRCLSECSYPSLSLDGSKLLYRRVFWTVAADGTRVRNSEIVTADLDGSGEVNLTQDPAYDVYPIWSHDGRWVYFSSVRPASERQMHLWRVPAQGGFPERLTEGEWHHRQAVPDRQGRKIYMFTFKRVGRTDVGYIGAIDVPDDGTTSPAG